MFDRYDAGEQAVLVHIYFTQDKDMEDLQEFESLVSSAGVEAMQVITGSRKAPHPKYFVGEGKAVEIADAVKATGASVVLFDHALSPAQERNLEALCECRVIDRTGLILDIFLRPSSPSFDQRSKVGTTTVKSCKIMEALIYGVMLMAKIENLLNAPPENISNNPNKLPLVKSCSIIDALTPGTGMCVPALNTMNMANVNNTFCLSSVILKILVRADNN